MTTDLFAPKSKKEQLFDWIKEQGRCRTSDIIKWGSENYHNRADRDARDLAQEGKIWRMRQDIQDIVYGFKSKESAWSIFEADKEIA